MNVQQLNYELSSVRIIVVFALIRTAATCVNASLDFGAQAVWMVRQPATVIRVPTEVHVVFSKIMHTHVIALPCFLVHSVSRPPRFVIQCRAKMVASAEATR